MHTRKAELSDLEGIVEVEKKAWPEGGAATKEQFISRIKTFSQGVIIAEDLGKIIGVVVGQIVSYERLLSKKQYSWSEITDNGMIKNTHQPYGDALFGVDLSVDPECQKKGVGKKLLLEIGRMAVRNNLKFGVLGARMPDYIKHAAAIEPDKYINFRKDGKLVDSELRFYEKSGLKLVRVIPNYFPDEDSLNYGVLAVWKNPFYVPNKFFGKIIGPIASLLFKI